MTPRRRYYYGSLRRTLHKVPVEWESTTEWPVHPLRVGHTKKIHSRGVAGSSEHRAQPLMEYPRLKWSVSWTSWRVNQTIPASPCQESSRAERPQNKTNKKMKNHKTTELVSPSSMDEFVQVLASLLESTIAANTAIVLTTMEREEARTTVLKENAGPVKTIILQTTMTDLKIDESVQANLIQEVKSLKEEIMSLKMMMMKVTFTNVAVKEGESSSSCERIANVQAQQVLACEDFFQLGSSMNLLDITEYITSVLEAFQKGEGIQLPNDVLYWPGIGGSTDSYRLYRRLLPGDHKAKRLQFQDIVVNHLHALLGSKPRIATDEQGKSIMFRE